MGAIAVPISHLFGPEAIEYRLADSGAKSAIADQDTRPKVVAVRENLPALRSVIGAAGAREANVESWESLLAKASDAFDPADTVPTDPATLIYTSGTTGAPKGALMPHSALLGNLPGFEHSHDGVPQEGDRFWSPADWAWTGGLFDALLPTLHHGRTIVGYRGRFDPEMAFDLLARYRVRNAFLFPTALKMMRGVAGPSQGPRTTTLRTMMSGGEPVGAARRSA